MSRIKILMAAAVAVMVAFPTGAFAKSITIGLASEPTSIDPHFHNLSPNNASARHLFDRLVLTDSNQKLIPGLAVSWKPVNDTTWEFKLRDGVKWHDGSPFTADDVVFTFTRAVNVPNSPSGFGTYIKGKTAVKIDDLTVQVKTEKPYPLMPNDMSTFSIVSKKNGQDATTQDYNSGKAAIGTGPYKFKEYVPGDRIVFVRNEDYWGDKPEWETVTFKPIKSAPSRVAAMLAGDVDMIAQVPTIDIERLKGDPKLSLSQGVSNRVIYLHLDHKRDNSPFVKANDGSDIKNPLKDVRVRRAISMAINRDAIVERVMEGVAIKAGQLLPDGFFGVSPNLKPVDYDPEGAKKLLAEAGVPDGFRLTIHGPNDRYINDAKIVEAIAQMLTRVGIKTEVVTMPRSVYFKRASRGGPDKTPEFSFILVGWGAGSGEASSPLKSLVHTYDKSRGFGASNRGRYSNPEVDKLIEDALATVDDAKRQDMLAKATEIAIEDVAVIPLHYQVNTWATRKGLKYRARTDEATLAMDVVSE
ncbi:ABC transporter, substrate-binding protein (cluster 5, nickel/peptides/opines) [hydrothermal vent metagenome]|uniref:ABC transporter, substrate-binding protein (Cluster 5, nickel/peptides/opines) n=1 Tax=hydrothermal vent metagenome TaxID=652676 RepID=A0A3B0T0Q7_9ZZZZ